MTGEQQKRKRPKPIYGKGVWLDDDLKIVDVLGGSRKVDVYLCESKSLKGDVVAKMLRPEHRNDDASLRAVQREGDILLKMSHPNVIEGHEVIPGGPSQAFIDRIASEYGRGSGVFTARVLGEFPAESLYGLVKRTWLEEVARTWDFGRVRV